MSNFLRQQPLILASGSKSRAKLLSSLGLEFNIIVSAVDEEVIKQAGLAKQLSLSEIAYNLARQKALTVSSLYPDSFVIAADQLCLLDELYFDKPLNYETALQQLSLLNGQTHSQLATTVIAKQQQILWQHQEEALLRLRQLSTKTIANYLRAEQPLQSCGSYHYEGLGKWLFAEVKGSESTILGLPLLPLSQALIDLAIVAY